MCCDARIRYVSSKGAVKGKAADKNDPFSNVLPKVLTEKLDLFSVCNNHPSEAGYALLYLR